MDPQDILKLDPFTLMQNKVAKLLDSIFEGFFPFLDQLSIVLQLSGHLRLLIIACISLPNSIVAYLVVFAFSVVFVCDDKLRLVSEHGMCCCCFFFM